LSDPVAIARFKQEAKTMAKLHHPNIAVIYDVGEIEGQVYLAEFLVEGETLGARLIRGALSWPEILNVLHSVASALDYAHEQGIVHRDIKPSNILLDKESRAYLCDFGLVRAAEGSASLSASIGGVKGTASYIAPEVWDAQEATAATDVYALSCVVFEMITSEVLFEGSSMMAVMRMHDRGPRFPVKWPVEIPEGVPNILQQGLEANPAKRINRAGKLVAALAALKTPAQFAAMEAEQAEADRLAIEKAEAERTTAEKAKLERRVAEQKKANQLAAEKSEAERVAVEHAQAEGLAMETKITEETNRGVKSPAMAKQTGPATLPEWPELNALRPTTLPEWSDSDQARRKL
jgi:serine/threonine protein kinase